MGLRELLILLLILAIVGVILRGLYVALRARRGQLRMALDKNIPQYDPDELLSSELPNGGARLVQRSFDEVVRRNSEFSSRDQAIPVLMDTVGDEDSLEEPPRQSGVASARNAARQKHGMRTATKPVHRPIDRMAAVAAASAAAPAVMSMQAGGVREEDDEDEDPRDARLDDGFDEFRNEPLRATDYRDDDEDDDEYDDAEEDYADDVDDQDDEDDEDDQAYEPDPEDDGRDADDDFDDDYDDDDYDDEPDEREAQDDAFEPDELTDGFDDAQDDDGWEEDQDGEDEEVDAEEFESVYGDEDDAPATADTWYEEEPLPVVEEETRSAPRRWLQWAGEKLSGMGAPAQERAAPDHEAREHGQRAEPVLGIGGFDEEEASAPRTVPRPAAAPMRPAREPLDKSRQKELSLDHPDDDILFDREERAAEKAQRQEVPVREKERGQGQARQQDVRGQSPLPQSPAPKSSVPKAPAPKTSAPLPREDAPAEPSAPAPDFSEVLVLNVVAKPEREFAGVDLLQVLLANQLRFGDMNIFHRHLEGDTRSPVLFSVANLVNPGTFDLNRISEFSTRGVCFFMTLPNVVNNMQAFDRMLDAAQQVRIALDADLKDDNRSVMTAQTIEHYRQRVRDFDLRQLRQPK